MRKSWPSPPGPADEFKPLSRPSAASWILLPFYLVLLVIVQVLDVGRFVAARTRDRLNRGNYWLAAKVDTLPCSLRTKYALITTVSWIPSVFLAVILSWTLADWMIAYQTRQNDLATGSGELDAYIQDTRILTDSWPSELIQASDEATITVSESELLDITARYRDLSENDREELSQRELINLALVHHFFGNEIQYQNFLDDAQKMDPNERIFAQ